MSFTALLPHTCRVHRREGQPDRLGQPSDRRYEAASITCRLTAAKGGETFEERSRDVIRATHTLFIEPGADLREDDTVDVEDTASGGILLQDANVMLVSKPYDSASEHHREAKLQIVRGSQ